MKLVSSAANPAVKQLVELRKARERRRRGLVLVEGRIEVERALAAGHTADAVYLANDAEPVMSLRADQHTRLTGAAAERAFVRERGGEVLAVIHAPSFSLADLPENPTSAMLAERIEKPGNWGAMLRSADGAGLDAVVAIDPAGDITSPSAVRASLGTVFSIPVGVGTIHDAIEWSRSRSLQLVALDPSGDRSLFDVDLRAPTALVIGAEHAGLSAALRAEADVLCSLPMAGIADSLNASAAAAVAMFEMVRQRGEVAG